ncbi:hypothetical protein EV401DRAFT_1887444 [Pisolithus croceorrhizus]|nr:hypothetical protein EV401DRAFT_1887444 [Pisolithus croceorrhizus]
MGIPGGFGTEFSLINAVRPAALICSQRMYPHRGFNLCYVVRHNDTPGTCVFYDALLWGYRVREISRCCYMCVSEWKPYLNNTGTNHKESPEITQELADAVKIPRGTIVTFSPGDLEVREKLRLASTRNATVEGMSHTLSLVHSGPISGLITMREPTPWDISWRRFCSDLGSCLPASVSAYNQTPYNLPSLEGEEMDMRIAALRGKLSNWEALRVHKQIKFLRPAVLQLDVYIFHIRHIGGSSTAVTGEDDSGSDTDSDSDGSAGLDEDASPHAVAAPLVGEYARALQMIARLGQPLNVLLLVQQPIGEYKPVAAEHEILSSWDSEPISPPRIFGQKA